ncbi:hypothetical protein B0H16DRAFT_1452937 [Mycena metata]|uniref:Uncharacterized protein n=1 Tax=Mycena metata TaxID=1033252 RepID=A0AAD7JT93_9AGAR|nr:hypothetical protein B0H16DRAFT_1452937 [Mycena metata]
MGTSETAQISDVNGNSGWKLGHHHRELYAALVQSTFLYSPIALENGKSVQAILSGVYDAQADTTNIELTETPFSVLQDNANQQTISPRHLGVRSEPTLDGATMRPYSLTARRWKRDARELGAFNADGAP